MEDLDKEITNFKVYLFNCDKTYKLEKVEALLRAVEEKSNFKFSVTQQYFPLPQMTEISTQVGSYQMDFAVFVVHANESRLSINEEKAGIGYAVLYRALLNAAGGRVLIVIGGDNYYNGEENSQVLSRWARMKIYSQFSPEYLDGRKSFIFSWDTQHRLIHEDALVHFLSKTNEEQIFQPVTRIEPVLQKEAENVQAEPEVDTQHCIEPVLQKEAEIIQVEPKVDTQHRLIHEDALVHFLSKTNEEQIFQPVTRIEPVLQKEAEIIQVEPKVDTQHCIEPVLQKEAEIIQVEPEVDTQHRVIHEDALAQFPNKTNEGQVSQPVTKIEPALQKEAENIPLEPEETFPVVGVSSKISEYGAAFKESQKVPVGYEEEREKAPLLQESSISSSPRPNRKVLIVCYGLQNEDPIPVVMNYFSEVSDKLGFCPELSFSHDPEILNAKKKNQHEYIILLMERNVFEREKDKVISLLALAEKKSALRSVIIISKDHEWEIGHHVSPSVEQSFVHGSTIVLSWNENDPRFSMNAHREFLEQKLKQAKEQRGWLSCFLSYASRCTVL